jgi:hypothetical protein
MGSAEPSPRSAAGHGLPAAAAAGVFCCGLCAVAMVALLMWGGWSPREHSIVTILGWSLGGFIAAMIASSWAPRRRAVGRFKLARAGGADRGGKRMILRYLGSGHRRIATALCRWLCYSSRRRDRHWRKQSGQYETTVAVSRRPLPAPRQLSAA